MFIASSCLGSELGFQLFEAGLRPVVLGPVPVARRQEHQPGARLLHLQRLSAGSSALPHTKVNAQFFS